MNKLKGMLVLGSVICLLFINFPFLCEGKDYDFGDPIGGPPDLPQRVFLEKFCSDVTARTNGEITIKYHPATIVNKEIRAIEMAKVGSLAFSTVGAFVGTIFPNVQVLELPYLLRDHNHFYKVIRGPIGKKMEAEIEKKHRLKVIYWQDWGFRNFINNKRPIYTPEDMKGLKMRIIASNLLRDIELALGAEPVPISWSEAVSAIQQGVVDGLCLSLLNVKTYKIWEFGKYVAVTKHLFTPVPIVANLKIWNEFTAQQQAIIEQIAKEAMDKNQKMGEKGDAELIPIIEEHMKVTTPDLTPFRRIAYEKVYPKYYEAFGKDLIEKIRTTE